MWRIIAYDVFVESNLKVFIHLNAIMIGFSHKQYLILIINVKLKQYTNLWDLWTKDNYGNAEFVGKDRAPNLQMKEN